MMIEHKKDKLTEEKQARASRIIEMLVNAYALNSPPAMVAYRALWTKLTLEELDALTVMVRTSR